MPKMIENLRERLLAEARQQTAQNGYCFSIAGEGLLMLLLYRQGLSLGAILCCRASVL